MKKFIHPLFVVCFISTLSGQDIQGGKDHPAISRYEGQIIRQYDYEEFDSYKLVTGVDKSGKPNKIKTLEGKVTRIIYNNPANRSTNEIIRNFELELKKAKAEILFTCSGGNCGSPIGWQPINGIRAMGGVRENRYVACRMTKDEKEIYAAIHVGRYATQMHIVEIKPMETDKVTVSAEAWLRDIDRDGHVAVYDILFETGKATLTKESRTAIREIATMLQQRNGLQLYVVGHTDNTGKLDMNMSLSEERAKAVVQSLIKEHGISAERLKGYGVGPLAPVATNANENGRAKNRRVELVAQ